jgi:hypothetical protein
MRPTGVKSGVGLYEWKSVGLKDPDKGNDRKKA